MHPVAPNLDNTDSVYVKQIDTDSMYVMQRIPVSDIDNVCICNIDILYVLDINSQCSNNENPIYIFEFMVRDRPPYPLVYR